MEHCYIRLQGLTTGPYTKQKIEDLLSKGDLNPQTPIFFSQNRQWKQAQDWQIFYPQAKQTSSLLPPPKWKKPSTVKRVQWWDKKKVFFEPTKETISPPKVVAKKAIPKATPTVAPVIAPVIPKKLQEKKPEIIIKKEAPKATPTTVPIIANETPLKEDPVFLALLEDVRSLQKEPIPSLEPLPNSVLYTNRHRNKIVVLTTAFFLLITATTLQFVFNPSTVTMPPKAISKKTPVIPSSKIVQSNRKKINTPTVSMEFPKLRAPLRPKRSRAR